MRDADKVPHHPALMCRIESLEYNFVTRRAVMRLPADNCADMTGAIVVVLRIDPLAREIITVSGDLPDTAYLRDERGEWYAVEPVLFRWHPQPTKRRRLFEKSC